MIFLKQPYQILREELLASVGNERTNYQAGQRLTSNEGYLKLRDLFSSVVTIMALSRDWHDFMGKLDQRHPRYGNQIHLPLDYQQDKDHGIGL